MGLFQFASSYCNKVLGEDITDEQISFLVEVHRTVYAVGSFLTNKESTGNASGTIKGNAG